MFLGQGRSSTTGESTFEDVEDAREEVEDAAAVEDSVDFGIELNIRDFVRRALSVMDGIVPRKGRRLLSRGRRCDWPCGGDVVVLVW